MKALTLWQPWASLVALGVKTIETRSWSTKYRGPLAIHAGMKAVPGDVGSYGIEDDTPRRSPKQYLMRGENMSWPYRLPLGAVVATCRLVDVVPMTDDIPPQSEWRDPWSCMTLEPWPILNYWPGFGSANGRGFAEEKPYGDFAPGRFAWLLDNVVPGVTPAKGAQGLWEWPVEMCGHGRPYNYCEIGGCS